MLEQRSGNLKTDEVVIAVRGIAFLCDFENVKAEFRLYVGERVIFIGYGIAVFFFSLG